MIANETYGLVCITFYYIIFFFIIILLFFLPLSFPLLPIIFLLNLLCYTPPTLRRRGFLAVSVQLTPPMRNILPSLKNTEVAQRGMGRVTRILTGGILTGLLIRYGLPKVLKMLGFHADYNDLGLKVSGKALIIATNQAKLKPRDQATGVASSEITHPYYDFVTAGLIVDVASIQGGLIPVDPQTIQFQCCRRRCTCQRSLTDPVFQNKLRNSLCINSIDVNDYDIIYFSGGWGAAYDFAQSKELADFVTAANASKSLLVAYAMVHLRWSMRRKRMANHY